MISHEHKCIFIHIAKCAGTSIEHAFGVDVKNYDASQNNFLFGWDNTNKLWLQHATPQQLIEYGYISREQWCSYYKIIIVRNSWDRAYSDYVWMENVKGIKDSFSNFLLKKGNFTKILNDDSSSYYAGDHLYFQKSYFFLNDVRIKYDCEIDFNELESGFEKIILDLNLKEDFFKQRLNSNKEKNKKHYSFFYNYKRKKMVERIYKEDIEFFKFNFINKKNFVNKILSIFN